MNGQKLIINADDLGRSTEINNAVIRAFESRLVSSATVMPNMPAFDEACSSILERHLELRVGTHLVLTAGEPLTARIRACRRLCDAEGRFRRHRELGRLLRLEFAETRAVHEELRAQVLACRSRGLPVTHLDSHLHIHTEPALARVVIAVARELEIPFVRIARNLNPRIPATTRAYHALFNARLRRANLAATRFFGDIHDYIIRRRGFPTADLGDVELMIHPELNASGQLVDLHCDPSGSLLEQLLAGVPGVERAVSYGGIS